MNAPPSQTKGDDIVDARGLTKEFKGFAAVKDVESRGFDRHTIHDPDRAER